MPFFEDFRNESIWVSFFTTFKIEILPVELFGKGERRNKGDGHQPDNRNKQHAGSTQKLLSHKIFILLQ
jgi:hypothetical protein